MWLGCCFYSEDQPTFQCLRAEEDIKLFKGLPSREEFETMLESFEGRHFLVILDDLMAKMAQSPLGLNIFMKLSLNLSPSSPDRVCYPASCRVLIEASQYIARHMTDEHKDVLISDSPVCFNSLSS